MFSPKSNCTAFEDVVDAHAKSEPPNFVGLTKDWTVSLTTEKVEVEGKSKFGDMTTELILGNIGTGSVSAVVVKGHYSTTATLEMTSAECCKST